jgi:carbamoyl-phosphate synthase large subunit
MSEIHANVAVTGINAKPDNPGPGLAVARCIKEAPEFTGTVVGLGYDALDPGFYLDTYCDSSYLLPYPSTGDEAFIASLSNIHAQEKIDVLIPCLDAELPGIVRLRPLIEEMGIKLVLPTPDQLRLRNKDQLPELAKLAGLQCPEIKSLTNPGFFYKCQDEGWRYPLVVKGLFYDAKVAHNPDEAAEAFRAIAAEWGYPVLAQQFLKGEEYNLTALGDGNGNMLGEVMMKKMAVTDKGKAWSGVSIVDSALYNASAELIKAIKWRGPLEVEVMRDKQGKYHLIEINPRFPAWIYLSVGVQRNLPLTLVRLALGEPTPEFPQPISGVLFIRHAIENIVAMSDFESVVMTGARKRRN